MANRTALTRRPFTAATARAAGYSRADLRRLLRGGAWVALRRGVYVDASVAADAAACDARRRALEVAGLLAVLKCDGVAAGTSAARIWGLDTLAAGPSDLVVVTSDPAAPVRVRDGYTLRTAAVPPHHRRERHGVAVTSAARTVVDLARTTTFREGVVVADAALRTGTVSPHELHEVLRDCRGWPGIAQAQRVVEFADAGAESVLESVSRVAIHEQGLPAPRTQVVIGDERESYARADFLWDGFGVIGEADGLAKYEPDGVRTTRQIVRAEKRREERLADAGYEIVRWGWADANDPPRLARRLRAAFARGLARKQGAQTGRLMAS